MKTYKGTPPASGMGAGTVVVVHSDGSERPLEHHVYHSPDGFSWGYGGSGPSELARCILWDLLGHEPAPVMYQGFKAAYVANWDTDQPFEIDETTIALFLKAEREARR